MKINPYYTNRENTPLRFLTFIKIILWLQMFLHVGTIVMACSEGFNAYLFFRTLFTLGLVLTALYGFNRLDWIGVQAYCGIYLLSLAEYGLTAGLYLYWGMGGEIPNLLSKAGGAGIWLLIAWLYFGKRRLVFTPVPQGWEEWLEYGPEYYEYESGEYNARRQEEEPYGQEPYTPEEPNQAPQYESHQYEPERQEPQRSAATETVPPWEESARKPRTGKVVLAVVLGLALVAGGGFLLWNGGTTSLTPAQAAERVLYLEVYNRSDVCLGSGSGFLVEDGKTLVTNYHVVEGAAYILVLTADGERELRVDTVLAWDIDRDLAILQCGEVLGEPLTLTDSDKVKQGDAIYAAGYPLGIANTLSDGIVGSRYVEDGVELLQITAAISHGSSGGALLNQQGQVIGVTTGSYLDGQNLNLAISSNEVKRMLAGETEPRTLTDMLESPLSTPTVYVPNETGTGINYALCYVEVGNTVTLSMMVDGKEVPREQVAWSSSDPDGMPVQNGVVWVDDNIPMIAEVTAVTKDGHKGSCMIYRKIPSKVHREGGILVYDHAPEIPSLEQVFGAEPMVGLWKCFDEPQHTNKIEMCVTYSYITPNWTETMYYLGQYEELLQGCGFVDNFRHGMNVAYEDSTGDYSIWITSEKTNKDMESYTIAIRITKMK